MRIRTLGAIITAGTACVFASTEKSALIDFEGLHTRGITEVPLHRLSHHENESERLTIGDQMDMLKEFLEDKTGKKLVSDGNPMIVSDLSQLNFHSSTFILAGLKAHDGMAADNGSIWLIKNSSHWQRALEGSVSAPDNAEWYIQPLELPSGDKFCNGMFMVMAMGGFQWSLGKHDTKPDCLNYFVPAWKLDDSGKFTGAMVYTFLLGMMTEAVTNFQTWLRPFLGTGRLRKFTMPLLYALQQWLGYIAMMVTMMYSVELFGSLLLGLVLGRLLFLPRSVTKPIIRADESAASPRNNSSVVTLSAIPESEETPLVRQTALRRRRT
ncbi:unnamed protein product [Cylindrotheca closterium]|uniref:Copper transporter n=1 Tax=Cylindrotheca closterium TaxID=2856 RepID=A0AAD2PUB8_9STRA|nr:unnamed protein product [Cylindrotheca closterium]